MNLLPRMETRDLSSFCRAHHISRLVLFGSALRPDFGPNSDIDLLVEFEPGWIPGLFGMARIERQLSAILGRKVDLRTAEDSSPCFRRQVLDEAQAQYAQG